MVIVEAYHGVALVGLIIAGPFVFALAMVTLCEFVERRRP